MFLNLIRVVALGLLLSACARNAPPLVSTPELTVVPGTVLPPPVSVSGESIDNNYVVGIGDQLSVTVFGIEELSRSVLVDAGGRISLPLAGSLVAAGRTLPSLEAEIQRRLSANYVRSPQVNVGADKIVSWTMTVDGEVRQPGIYPMAANMSLLKAVASARGTTEFTKLDDVVVFRTVGDQRMAALYNLEAIRRGAYPDPPIFGEDIIVVGDSPARRMFRDIVQLGPAIASPIVALLSSGTL